MMELKEINVNDIVANASQPREEFDKEKLQELAESILSNGLLNPISVREIKPGKYMIVAGERRWRAHKLAELKTIQAFVKVYKNDEWMVESLIENVHREELTSIEKENSVYALWKTNKFKTYVELGKKLAHNPEYIADVIRAKEVRDKTGAAPVVKTRIITDTEGLEEEDRKVIFTKVEKGELFSEKVRNLVRVIKIVTPDVKEALLSDEINVEQAEKISKLKSAEEREKAIKEHAAIKNIENNVEKNIKNQTSAKSKRSLDRRLVEVKNWLTSFRNSVGDSRSQLEKTFKILIIATRFLPVMDDNQKERLEADLDRLLETIEKAKQLSEKIQGFVEKNEKRI